MEKGVHCTTKSRSGAIGQLMFMVSSPLQWQKSAPTREEAEKC
jgi:hypothetical protein